MEIIIIVGHGSLEKEAGNIEFVVEHLHGMIHGKCKDKCVRIAYLQFLDPDLRAAIKAAVKDGAKKIIVHPYFLSGGVHVSKNIPKIIKESGALYPDVEFVCTGHLGAHDKLVEVVLERIKEAGSKGK
ncbi:MAG: CbiX/SirB N-terminal domain-containing protein [Nitrospira sp.]|nr:CbiX/SirB N-terminal domain-containing protein [Nitrospira sp.]